MSRPRASEFSTARLEAARVLARYRKLILLGRLRLPHDAARSLVGPDCAYHLYGRTRAVSGRRKGSRARSRP